MKLKFLLVVFFLNSDINQSYGIYSLFYSTIVEG